MSSIGTVPRTEAVYGTCVLPVILVVVAVATVVVVVVVIVMAVVTFGKLAHVEDHNLVCGRAQTRTSLCHLDPPYPFINCVGLGAVTV